MVHQQPIRVLIVEAFEIMRHGLRSILNNSNDIEVIGEASNVESALALCTSLQPDVILMDTNLADIQGLPAIQAICESQPHLQVIALVRPDKHQLMEAVMQSAAIGCLTKNVRAEELIHAIRLAAAGKPAMIWYPTHRYQPTGWLSKNLTKREQEVLKLLTRGLTNRQIAVQLEVSLFTIKNHVSKLLSKLGATSRTEAAILALQHGLVQMD